MKTQIIQVDRYDDFISLRDKMSWSQTSRILLVWPKKGVAKFRRLDLSLINRHANTLGAQLALVTMDPEIQYNAMLVGIPVFNDLRHAQETLWRQEKRSKIDLHPGSIHPNLEEMRKSIHPKNPTWLSHPATRIICFSVSVLAIFILGVYILPGAKIILYPQVKNQTINLSVVANPSLNEINLPTGGLPVYLQEVVVEGRDSITTTGSVTIPDQFATGELHFTNLSDQIIAIPPGTTVSTIDRNPIRFITTSDNEISVKSGDSVDIIAQSVEPGFSANLAPNTLIAIQDELGLGLTVTNPDAMRGGTDAAIPAPSSQDLLRLRQRLLDTLSHSAVMEMNSQIPVGDTLITPTIKLINIIDETSIPQVEEPGNQLNLSMRLRFQSQVVASDIINQLVTPILDANIPTGFSPVEGTIVLKQLSPPKLGKDGYAHWMISAQRKLQAQIGDEQPINLVKGLSPAQAAERLNDILPLADEAQIMPMPTWWPRLPFLPMRIQVVQLGPK